MDGKLLDISKPLTAEEKKKFHEILNSDELFEEWVERAVRGRRAHARRATRPGTAPR